MVTAGAAHAFGVCTAKWLRAAARAPYFRYMAKQQNPIQRREVLIARGYICTLPKRGVERSERAGGWGRTAYPSVGLNLRRRGLFLNEPARGRRVDS